MNELEYGTIFEKGVPNPFGEYFSAETLTFSQEK